MYKHKYEEYKNRYLDLKRQIGEKIYDESKFEFLGVHVTVPVEKKRFDSINEFDFVYDVNSPDIEKILYINTVEQFDAFTDKYGGIFESFVYVNWDEVAKDFKGFGMDIDSNNSLFKRFGSLIFKGNEYNSWWELEYDVDLEDVVIFLRGKQFIGLIDKVKIKMIDFENINPYNITHSPSTPDKHKIVYIKNVAQFDEFTNKYGEISENLVYIYIKWDKVSQDFRGFGLDIQNKKLYKKRFKFAKYKGAKYGSWWEYEYNLSKVALFD